MKLKWFVSFVFTTAAPRNRRGVKCSLLNCFNYCRLFCADLCFLNTNTVLTVASRLYLQTINPSSVAEFYSSLALTETRWLLLESQKLSQNWGHPKHSLPKRSEGELPWFTHQSVVKWRRLSRKELKKRRSVKLKTFWGCWATKTWFSQTSVACCDPYLRLH